MSGANYQLGDHLYQTRQERVDDAAVFLIIDPDGRYTWHTMTGPAWGAAQVADALMAIAGQILNDIDAGRIPADAPPANEPGAADGEIDPADDPFSPEEIERTGVDLRDEWARQKFVDAVNAGMERGDNFGQLVRNAVLRATGREGPIS